MKQTRDAGYCSPLPADLQCVGRPVFPCACRLPPPCAGHPAPSPRAEADLFPVRACGQFRPLSTAKRGRQVVTVVARVSGPCQQPVYSDIGRPNCQANSGIHAMVSPTRGASLAARPKPGPKAPGPGRAARAERYVPRGCGAACAARGVSDWWGELIELDAERARFSMK